MVLGGYGSRLVFLVSKAYLNRCRLKAVVSLQLKRSSGTWVWRISSVSSIFPGVEVWKSPFGALISIGRGHSFWNYCQLLVFNKRRELWNSRISCRRSVHVGWLLLIPGRGVLVGVVSMLMRGGSSLSTWTVHPLAHMETKVGTRTVWSCHCHFILSQVRPTIDSWLLWCSRTGLVQVCSAGASSDQSGRIHNTYSTVAMGFMVDNHAHALKLHPHTQGGCQP